jgi:hypothetical protein
MVGIPIPDRKTVIGWKDTHCFKCSAHLENKQIIYAFGKERYVNKVKGHFTLEGFIYACTECFAEIGGHAVIK